MFVRQLRVRNYSILLGIVFACGAAEARSLHVDDDYVAQDADGSTTKPYPSVSQAIAAAADGDLVLVAQGRYPENLEVLGKTVGLFGGFRGASAADYNAGKAGNFAQQDVRNHASELRGVARDRPVITLLEAGASVVDGFRISGGTGYPFDGTVLGGGIYCEAGTPTIRNNLIEGNDLRGEIASEGGGLMLEHVSAAHVIGNTIRGNYASKGAGIAGSGAKIVIFGNIVRDNVGTSDHGGGVYLTGTDLSVADNHIINNEIGRTIQSGVGGGIILFGQGTTATLSRNVISENYAPDFGSGVYIDDGAEVVMRNELVFANQCAYGGTGIAVEGAGHLDGSPGSQVTLLNVTVAGHACRGSTLAQGLLVEINSRATVRNSIFAGNGSRDIGADSTSETQVSYTRADRALPGAGNITEACAFVGGNDFHLRSTRGRWDPNKSQWVVDTSDSPCIDRGEIANASAEAAPNGGLLNLGAYGGSDQSSLSARGTTATQFPSAPRPATPPAALSGAPKLPATATPPPEVEPPASLVDTIDPGTKPPPPAPQADPVNTDAGGCTLARTGEASLPVALLLLLALARQRRRVGD